ncbi:5710_t:CDS:2 [Funneliformis mosseae]|uniref:5710_t:CDS:1 n=1 Tax=Funneliformis mosseae TaxID=27381 RepID=A0A9N9B109_FUNMO|nr:5710_t:CDS:2 [Funneliformis mosseae]
MKATWVKTDSFVINLLFVYRDQILRCFGISQEPNSEEYLLIMQYANGGDFQNYLEKNFKNLTWYNKKKLARQISDRLNYLHNENILHRDLHSKNVVIHDDNAKNAKITDFDLSYQYTKFSDIYSYGVLMWETSSEAIEGTPKFMKRFRRSVGIQRPRKDQVLEKY